MELIRTQQPIKGMPKWLVQVTDHPDAKRIGQKVLDNPSIYQPQLNDTLDKAYHEPVSLEEKAQILIIMAQCETNEQQQNIVNFVGAMLDMDVGEMARFCEELAQTEEGRETFKDLGIGLNSWPPEPCMN